MFCKPLACAFHEKPVKVIIWDSFLDITDIGRRNAKFEDIKREFNQIPFSVELHQRITVSLIFAYLVHLDIRQISSDHVCRPVSDKYDFTSDTEGGVYSTVWADQRPIS